MEVVVVFEGGDPDKPMVLGTLYNGTHPPPFVLPASKTRSGWRTQSSPGGGGNNELSFEDAVHKEQIYVHAQRDLDEVVERDHTLLVKGDEHLHVVGAQTATVDGSRVEKVLGSASCTVSGDEALTVAGSRLDVVGKASEARVTEDLTTKVGRRERREVAGRSDLSVDGDYTVRTRGCHTTIVGRHDKKRSYVLRVEGTAQISTSETIELDAEKGLTLRCGKSFVKIGKDRVEIVSPSVSVRGEGAGLDASDGRLKVRAKADVLLSAETILLKTKDASLGMKKDVEVAGARILLNSPENAADPVKDTSAPPTSIQLKDAAGKPLAYQRFLITMADGAEHSGILDRDGRIEMDVEGSGTITFPDTSSAS